MRMSSDRTFGLTVGGILIAVGFAPLLRYHPPRLWISSIGACLVLAALMRPSLLNQLNRAWTELGKLLHKAMSPIILAAMFFLVITPVALLMRLLKRDALKLRLDASLPSYWEKRESSGPYSETMRHPF